MALHKNFNEKSERLKSVILHEKWGFFNHYLHVLGVLLRSRNDQNKNKHIFERIMIAHHDEIKNWNQNQKLELKKYWKFGPKYTFSMVIRAIAV